MGKKKAPDIMLPRYSASSRPDSLTALRGITLYDQYDDWLPDPVYYADQVVNSKAVAAVAKRVDDLFTNEKLESPASVYLQLPRNSGESLRALALPLDARICAHVVIAAMASRISTALLRDKVYGFELTEGRFSTPGEGLVEVMQNALEAALFTTGGLRILDIESFNNKADISTLERTLLKMKASSAETKFLRDLLTAPVSEAIYNGTLSLARIAFQSRSITSNLLSVDDAFAFLYNFYLQPVDKALADSKLNFFRYRDEYFVFSEDDEKRVTDKLKDLKLRARVVATYRKLDLKDNLSERVNEDRLKASEVIGSFGGGEIVATYECDTWNQKEKTCVTDSYEVSFSLKENFADLFTFSPDRPLDCIQILPFLRAMHRVRAPEVLRRSPSPDVPKDLAAYRLAIQANRDWLRKALSLAVERRVNWQITWVTQMLSDLGTLSSDEAEQLRRVVNNRSIGPAAKAQAYIALARNGAKLSINDFWDDSYSGYMLRAAMLTARYLFDHGERKAWATMQSLARSKEPDLANYLFPALG